MPKNAIKRPQGRAGATAASSGAGTGERSGGLRDDLKLFTRNRIIESAMESFAADGFRGTTVDRIVARAGTTTPTFYRHFTSKHDLLAPLQRLLEDEMIAVFGALDRPGALEAPALRQWLDLYALTWQRLHKLCGAYWEAVDQNAGVAEQAMSDAIGIVERIPGLVEAVTARCGEAGSLRMALMIPLLDRVMQVSSNSAEPGLSARVLDEFALIMAGALRAA